jgi:UDP-glucose 4-epimerase
MMTSSNTGAHPLAGKKVLVTGGAGFVGSHIADLLADAGCGEVLLVDNLIRGCTANLAQARRRGNVTLVEADIRDKDLMDRMVEGADTVFHQAALRITHCAAEPREAMEVMVDATFDLFESCVRHGVRKVVFASSASVYGMAEQFPTTEGQHPYANRTLYGSAKVFGEGLLRSLNDLHGLNYVALRYFNVYGPRMDLHGRYTEVLIRWMERISAGQPPLIFGDGLQTMDFVHVMDVARANLLAATADVSDVVFNVGNGAETSLAQLAQAMASAMGRPDLAPVHAPERAVNPVPRRLADVSAARKMLGFTAQTALEPGLRDLVAWWRSERAAALQSAAA